MNKHIGPRFDELLNEEGTLESAELADKKVIAEQVTTEMKNLSNRNGKKNP